MIQAQTNWLGRARLICPALERAPIATRIAGDGKRRQIVREKAAGLCWRYDWISYRQKRDRSVIPVHHQAWTGTWGVALDVAFSRRPDDPVIDAIVETAWRLIAAADEPWPLPSESMVAAPTTLLNRQLSLTF